MICPSTIARIRSMVEVCAQTWAGPQTRTTSRPMISQKGRQAKRFVGSERLADTDVQSGRSLQVAIVEGLTVQFKTKVNANRTDR